MDEDRDALIKALSDYQKDTLAGLANKPSTGNHNAYERHKLPQRMPKTTKQWEIVKGDPLKCKVCQTINGVVRLRPLFNTPLCPKCKKGLLEGEIDPMKIVPTPKPPQPMDTGGTTKGKTDQRITRAMQNARWIRCHCGRKFKTRPFKPYITHPPAFEKFVRHAKGEEGHYIVEYSDRNPNGESAILSRFYDLPHIDQTRNKGK